MDLSSLITGVDWITIVSVVALLALVAPYAQRWLVDAAYGAHLRGIAGPAFALARALRRLPGSGNRRAGAWLLAAVHADRGETTAAVEATQLMLLGLGHDRFSWRTLTDATNHLVNAGLYREAVLLPRAWPAAPRRAARRKDRVNYVLAHVNRAEALHNLGRHRAALRLLSRVEADAGTHALAREGLLLLKAWILDHLGELTRAARALAGIRGRAIGRHYAPELHYARSRLELGRGRLDRARREATLGLRASVRAASERNGLFLLGEISIAEGEPDRAIEELERGLACRYQGQGGASLLVYAGLLRELGRSRDALAIEDLVLERDPQSFAAAAVREKRPEPEHLAT